MSGTSFVVLPGLILPRPVLLLALDLERRGVSLRNDGDELVVGPGEALTEADRDEIRRWKLHLQALVAFSEDVAGRVQ
jgi:hypothetical protein